jgi:hypothetical protein
MRIPQEGYVDSNGLVWEITKVELPTRKGRIIFYVAENEKYSKSIKGKNLKTLIKTINEQQ